MRTRCALAGIVLLALPAGAATLRVNARDLPAAVDRAAAGDTIRVEGGRLAGTLVILKPLTLIGINHPTIDAGNRGTVVRLAAPGIVFSGFRVARSGASLLDDDAGVLVTAPGVTVSDCVLQEVLHGIYLIHADRFRLLRNRISGKGWLNDENRGNGIHLHASGDGTIEGNAIEVVRDGVYFNYASRNLIAGNRATRLRYGLHYMWSHDNRFLDNEFRDNVGGAAIMYSHGIVFERNTFAHHRGFRAHGVLFKDVERCRAAGNRFLDNTEGITLDGAIENRFEDNLVAGNDAAIVEYASSEGNVFTGNAFVANGTELREVGQRSSTLWDEGGRGNYWSSYAGYDLEADGIGDVPHRPENLFDYLEGQRPLLRLLTFSPAAAAVRNAESAFPVFRQRQTVDRFPLMRVPGRVAALQSGPGVRGPRGGRRAAAAALVLASGLAILFAGRRRG